jgi:hypothetical protein
MFRVYAEFLPMSMLWVILTVLLRSHEVPDIGRLCGQRLTFQQGWKKQSLMACSQV